MKVGLIHRPKIGELLVRRFVVTKLKAGSYCDGPQSLKLWSR